MPAEWEPQHAMWLAWPSPDGGDFLGIYRESVAAAYVAMIDALLDGQHVYLNNGSLAAASGCLEAIPAGKRARLHLLDIPSSEWCRDFGPTFLIDGNGALGAIDWKFTKWGGKYADEFPNDADAAPRMCARAGVDGPNVFASPGVTLEGGGIEVNGAGVVLTTESCVLNPNRNPGANRAGIESMLADYLGTRHVIWLNGTFENDDTDGHIDTLARFTSAGTVAVQTCADPEDRNYAVARENVRRLEAARLPDGSPLTVVALPPLDRMELQGVRMPASYANFLIANRCVLVPQYGVRQDPAALEVIAGLFPGRKAVPIDCSGIIWGRGALHCISQQLPRHTPSPEKPPEP